MHYTPARRVTVPPPHTHKQDRRHIQQQHMVHVSDPHAGPLKRDTGAAPLAGTSQIHAPGGTPWARLGAEQHRNRRRTLRGWRAGRTGT